MGLVSVMVVLSLAFIWLRCLLTNIFSDEIYTIISLDLSIIKIFMPRKKSINYRNAVRLCGNISLFRDIPFNHSPLINLPHSVQHFRQHLFKIFA